MFMLVGTPKRFLVLCHQLHLVEVLGEEFTHSLGKLEGHDRREKVTKMIKVREVSRVANCGARIPPSLSNNTQSP